MLDFTWKVFTQTGSIDTYLLFKELEKENGDGTEAQEDELAELDFPVS
ncbi:YqzL family protein [Bacillus kexueae]|nr:YqzL family protein [Bacillus kexueae]